MPFAVDPRSYDEKRFEVHILEGVASGSPQFSLAQFKRVIQKLPQKKIVVVDLRQEFHWFVRTPKDWMPVNLFGAHFTYNRTLSSQNIIDTESQLCQTLNSWPLLQVMHITGKDEGKVKFHQRIQLTRDPLWVDFCLTEAQLLKKYMPSCVTYYRLPVQDHHFPSDEIVQSFVKIVKNNPDAWFHFHCKGGRGRTTTFLMLTDMIKHKHKFTLDQYIQRQIDIDGPDFRKSKYKNRRMQLEKFLKGLGTR